MQTKKTLVSQINCANCGAPIKPNVGEQIFTCPFCQSVQHVDIEWKEIKADEMKSFTPVPEASHVQQRFPGRVGRAMGVVPLVFRILIVIAIIIFFIFIIRGFIKIQNADPFLGGFPDF